MSFWHDGVPAAEHPEEASKPEGDCWNKKLDWSKNGVAKVIGTPIKVEKSRDLNIGSEALST